MPYVERAEGFAVAIEGLVVEVGELLWRLCQGDPSLLGLSDRRIRAMSWKPICSKKSALFVIFSRVGHSELRKCSTYS